jgi:exodeoxyribonuclease-3
MISLAPPPPPPPPTPAPPTPATGIRLATWNINSIRARFELAERFIRENNPDILCLQETKVADELFPHDWCREMGFEHIAIAGQKAYSGVAVLSKLPLQEISRNGWCGKDDARHLEVKIPYGDKMIELHNFYIPAGGDIPDPETNDKFAHKLQFFDELIAWSTKLDPTQLRILVGDLNVAPLEEDVWSHKALLKIVSHTPIEVDLMNRFKEAHGWIDVMREFVPASEKLYSWWSYRAADWEKADKGRRLDHVWVSPALEGAARAMKVAREARGWEKPSDHAPVIVDFAF